MIRHSFLYAITACILFFAVMLLFVIPDKITVVCYNNYVYSCRGDMCERTSYKCGEPRITLDELLSKGAVAGKYRKSEGDSNGG